MPKIARCLETILYDRMPELPAINKWMKQFHPCVFWLCGFILGTTAEMLFRCQGRKGETSTVYQFDADHVIGPSEDKVVCEINISRNRKTNFWLQNQPTSWDTIATATLLFKLAMSCLYSTFSLASSHRTPSLVAFIDPESGPPTKLLESIFDKLTNLDDPHWILLRRSSSGDWTPEKIELLFVTATTLYGHTAMWCVELFEDWPWPFRFMRQPHIPVHVKRDIIVRFSKTCNQCREDLMSDPMFVANGGEHGVLAMTENSDDIILADRMFGSARPSNQSSELRFARASGAVAYRAGGYVKMGQLAARHTVSEHAGRWGRIARKALDKEYKAVQPSSLITSPLMLYFKQQNISMEFTCPRLRKMSPARRCRQG